MRKSVRVLYVDEARPPAELADADDVVVSTAETAAAATSRLAGSGEVDCVVSEYDLPDADGVSLLETVREDYPNLPYVLFTESGDEKIASEALGKGVTDYLPKGECGHELRERVARAVAESDVEAQSGLSGDRMRELTNAFPDVAFILDEAGRYLEVLSGPGTADLPTYDQEQLPGRYIHDAFDDAKADQFIDHIHTTLESGGVETLEYHVETADGPRWFEGRAAPLGRKVDGRDAVVWVARDVTERRENERRLAVRRDELATLNRINGLINSILQSLVESVTREEIERTVCEELADSEFYEHAWTGIPWGQAEQMSPSVIEGTDREPVERILAAAETRLDTDNWFGRVAVEGESLVIPDVAEDARLPDDIREMMLGEGFTSAAMVPLTYGNTNYGILGICGTYPGSFGDRELSALETLAEVVAFAINAVKNRNLLFSDTAVELEFRVRNAESALARASADLDCRLTLEGFVEVSEDRMLEYVAVEGASAAAVRDVLDDDESDGVEEFRIVSDDGESLMEVLCSRSGVTRLVKAGTVVKSATVEDGDVRFVTEAPSDVDVRSIIDSFRVAYPDSELVSKREVDRPVHTAKEFRQTLNEELTEKQRNALQTAYFAGYYEYPRESTAEEVADALDISSPTLHQHLRSAQRKLVGTFLD